MIIERRLHPRFTVHFPVEMKFTDDTATLAGTAINLSLSGLQIQINKVVADTIMGKKTYPVEFMLSVDTPHLILTSITTRVIINRRISEDDFQMGVKFCNLNDVQLNSLKLFISSIQT